MFDLLGRLLPMDVCAPALLAGLAWAGVNYLVIGPEIGQRLGNLQYHGQCVARVQTQEDEQRRAHEKHRRRLIADAERARTAAAKLAAEAKRQAEIAAGARNLIFSFLPPNVGNHLYALTGQRGFVDKLRQAPAIGDVSDVVPELPSIPETLPPADPADHAAVCRCAAERTVAGLRTDLAIYTGSLALYEPAGIARFAEEMTDATRGAACGASER